jgi:cytochrome c biogenesis protein CcmG/thiol:disulfide interchange protein DsbE
VSDTQQAKPARPIWRLIYLLPLGLFMVLVLVFFSRLEFGGDPDAIPSALIGKPAPDFALPPLAGLPVPGLQRADFAGKVTIVNVFASWCVPCRAEHPVLTELAKDTRIRVVGINYKDQPGNALAFLNGLGNPYAAVGVDQRGRAAIDWGVYGVPETFLVGRDGVIATKVIGPLDPDNVERQLKPAIEKALAAG